MFHPKLLRAVSRLLIVTLTALALQPLSAAAQAASNQPAQPAAPGPGERYARMLAEMEEAVHSAAPQAFVRDARTLPSTAQVKNSVARLRVLHGQARALEAQAEAEFDAIGRHLQDKNLPAEILARHAQAVADYQSRKAEFKRLMQALEAADDAQSDLTPSLTDLAGFMAQHSSRKAHTPTDPNKLPWGTPKPVTREPFTTAAQFQLSRLLHEPVKLAAAGSLSGLGLPSATLPATPTAEDLAETEDVQLTPAIRAQAEALGKNPVQIYNWVRNSIEYLPTYGSIQGADLTLQTKRGNAFDTASLLIALLRASGIAARYVYGTVEVPADKVMNWVGGVTVPGAAQSLMGQGGIPNVGLSSGGQIKAIRFEHVWVEAYVDYVPSRGAKHVAGDTWVPMDASLKQYQYTQGMDIKGNVAFDAPGFLDQAQSGATVNEAEGWVQNVNQANIQTALTAYQNQVKTYIEAQKPNATVGDVLGAKTIQPQTYSILMGTLPYKTVATGAKMAALPDNLRWKFRYTLYGSDIERAFESPMFAYVGSLPKLSGKKITLSYQPATQADLDLINSYLPKPHADGSPIQPSELPSSLPGYLIKLIPELRVAGQVVATGQVVTMGAELVSTYGLFDPAGGWEDSDDNRPTAGEYVATLVDGQGVSAGQLQAHKDKLSATKAKLEAIQYEGLTKEDLSGDILYSAILVYFAAGYAADQLAARASSVVEYLKPSYGSFFTAARVALWWGLPKQVSFPGLIMDVDRYMTSAVAKDNDAAKSRAHVLQSGMRLSAYEHLIPEKLFTSEQNPGEGVSAVKALAVAAAQGQRIYTITAANLNAAYAIQIDEQARQEIVNALYTGKRVTVHEKPINVSGWVGSGYVIGDPESGAGAYKISGGTNGAALMCFIGALMAVLGLYLLPAAAGILLLVYGLHLLYVSALILMLTGGFDWDVFSAVRVLGLVLGTMLVDFVWVPTVLLTIVGAVALWLVFKILFSAVSHRLLARPDDTSQLSGKLQGTVT